MGFQAEKRRGGADRSRSRRVDLNGHRLLASLKAIEQQHEVMASLQKRLGVLEAQGRGLFARRLRDFIGEVMVRRVPRLDLDAMPWHLC